MDEDVKEMFGYIGERLARTERYICKLEERIEELEEDTQ